MVNYIDSQMNNMLDTPSNEVSEEEEILSLNLRNQDDIPNQVKTIETEIARLDRKDDTYDPVNYTPPIFKNVDMTEESTTDTEEKDDEWGVQRRQVGTVEDDSQVADLRITIRPSAEDIKRFKPPSAAPDIDLRSSLEQGLDFLNKAAISTARTPGKMLRSWMYGTGKAGYDLLALAGYGLRYSPNAVFFPIHSTLALLARGADTATELFGYSLIDDVDKDHWARIGAGQSLITDTIDGLMAATHIDTVGREVFDSMFAFYKVAPEHQNSFTRSAQLVGEFGGIFGAVKAAGVAGIGLISKEGWKQGLLHNFKSWVGGNVPKEVIESGIDKSIKRIQKQSKKLDEAAASGGKVKYTNRLIRSELRQLKRAKRYLEHTYSPQMMSKRVLKLQGQNFMTFKKSNLFDLTVDAYKPIAEMAIAGSVSQVMAENMLEAAGLEEHKPWAAVAGFGGALFGAVGPLLVFGAAYQAGKSAVETLWHMMAAHSHRITGNTDEQMRHHLKSMGISDSKIREMTNEVVEDNVVVRRIDKKAYDRAVAFENPKTQQAFAAIGRALDNIPEGEFRDEVFAQINHMYKPVDSASLKRLEGMRMRYERGEITKAEYITARDKFEAEVLPNAGLAEQFNFKLHRDVEDGYISPEALGRAGKELELFFDQITHSHALSALRQNLMRKIDLGLHNSIDRMKIITILDDTTKLLDNQQVQLEASLKAIHKRISGTKDIEQANSRWYKIHEHAKNRLEMLKSDSQEQARRLEDIFNNIRNPTIHPSNTPDIKDSLDTAFGKSFGDDVQTVNTIRATQGLDPDALPSQTEITQHQGDDIVAHGKGLRNTLNESRQSMNSTTRKLYNDAYLDEDAVDATKMMTELSGIVSKTSAYSRVPPNLQSIKSEIIAGREVGLNLEVSIHRSQGDSDEQIVQSLILHHEAITKVVGVDRFPPLDTKRLLDNEGVLKPTAIPFLINTLKKAPITPDVAPILRTIIPFKKLSEYKTTAYSMLDNAERQGKGLQINAYKEQVKSWSKTMDDAEQQLIQRSKGDVALKRQIANNWYKNTQGATYQKWGLKSTVRDLRNNGVTQMNTKNPDYKLFNRFFPFAQDHSMNDAKAAAEQFKTAFASKRDLNQTVTIKNADGKEEVIANPNFGKYLVDSSTTKQITDLLNNPEKLSTGELIKRMESTHASGDFAGEIPEHIKKQFLLSLRHHIEQKVPGYAAGLKAMDQTFINEFLLKTNMLSKTEKDALEDVLKWRAREIEVAKEKRGDIKDDLSLLRTLIGDKSGLQEELKTALGASVYQTIIKSDDDKLFDILFGTKTAGYDVTVKSEKAMREALERGDITQEVFDLWNRNRKKLKESFPEELQALARQQGTTTDDIISKIGPRMVDDPAYAGVQSPLVILWQNLEGVPNSDKVKEAIRSLFSKKLLEDAFSFTPNKMFWPGRKELIGRKGRPFTQAELEDGMAKGNWTLSREMDITNFGKMLHDREGVLNMIYKDDPQHLNDIKLIFELGAAAKGRVLSGDILELPMKQSMLSVATKFYNIARDFVSPRYVFFDLSFRQAQVQKAKLLQLIMTDRNTARTMVKFAQDGPKNAPKYVKELKNIFITTAIMAEEELYEAIPEEDPVSSFHVRPEKVLIGILKSFFANNQNTFEERHAITSGKKPAHFKVPSNALNPAQINNIPNRVF